MPTRLALIATLIVGLPAAAAAQTDDRNLADVVPRLLLTGITLASTGDPNTHAGHFTLGDPRFSQPGSIPNAGAIAAIEAFADRFTSQVANFPLGSSTGGLTYTYEAATGLLSRRTSSFGPAFAERAVTIGRGRYSVGANFQRMTFDTFGGEDLKDGSITFYLPHTDCCAGPPSPLAPGFEGDVVETALRLRTSTSAVIILANAGITDRFDVGIAVPITHVSVEADVQATILRLSTFSNPLVHTFVPGEDVGQVTLRDSATATGLGDLVLRAKYNLFSRGATGLSAGLDLRLPTGDEDNFLGLGTTQAKVLLIASAEGDRIAPHANVGFTVSGEGRRDVEFVFEPLGASDEFNYAAGVEVVATPRLTIIGDLIGRTLFDAGQLRAERLTFQYREGIGTPASAPLLTSETNPLTGAPYRQLALSPGNLNLTLGALGAKYNPPGTDLLVAGNVLFPLTSSGLRDRLTFTIGMDFAF